MKNAINYYYNLVTFDIHQKGKKYRFKVEKDSYFMCLCERNIDELKELYELNIWLLQHNILCHQIILNNSNEIVTVINNESYILMKVFIDDERKVSFDDVYLFNRIAVNNNYKKLIKNNWRFFWMNKIDYFEYQISEFGKKYPIIRENFSYFIGLAETGINLLYDFDYSDNLVVSHQRIKKNMSMFDLYNPLNLIVDSKVRDISEYFKNDFFDNDNVLEDIKEFLMKSNFNSYELYLFYVRMFYPSFYFDLYEKIIDEKVDEERLAKIISKINDYENMLKDLYWFLRPYVNLPNIEWIIKT